MRFAIARLTEAHARDITGWPYEAEYALYSFGEDVEGTVNWALDPMNRIHAVVGADGSLVAYCSFGADGQVPGWEYDDTALDIGVGLRPELTGQGLGQAVIEAAVAHAEDAFEASNMRVTVAPCNERALTVCRRAGFEDVAQFEGRQGRSYTVLVRRSSPPLDGPYRIVASHGKLVREMTMDWKTKHADKFMSPEEAVGLVKDGQKVWVGMYTSTPETLSNALFARSSELHAVEIHAYVAPFVWSTPETQDAFHVVTVFATPADRQQVNAGLADYIPVGNFQETSAKAAVGSFDVSLIKTSPPDENGWLSYGAALWFNRSVCDISKKIVCEVDENAIRTYGENYLHISEVTAMVEHQSSDDRGDILPPRSDEVIAQTEVIGTMLAAELINDGDTLQIGIGDVTAALAVYLGDKHDLGIQTELMPGGVMDLMDQGVVTGKYKQVAPGKAIASAFAAVPAEELARAHMNPKLELWDFSHTDDIRTLVHEENFVAINNAMQIDLTGQVTAESLNGKVFSGPGGQTVFAVSASYSEGGRSIIAVPSNSIVDGESKSRIVGAFPPATVVTVPRTFVDYVVTEHGIASLRGKTVRQRAEELISVSHPDFRADLRKEAENMYAL